MSLIMLISAAAGCGYLAGNQKARAIVFNQLRTLSGKAIDGLNKRGADNVQPPDNPEEQQPEN